MHTLTAALALGLVSTAALAVPAHAADPAPTNVQVAWADAAHTTVRVTWDEVGVVPNRVYAQYPDGPGAYYAPPADGTNQMDIASDALGGQPVLRMGVIVVDSAGQATSPAGLSVLFDTLRQPKPIIDSIASVPPTKYAVKWHASAPTPDPNPGDPLDLPAAAPQYQVWANPRDFNQYEPRTPWSTATQATFERPTAPPFKLSVAVNSEWGLNYAQTHRVDYEKIPSLTIPTTATYGQLTVIKGRIERWMQACDPGPCFEQPWTEAPRTVILQARANATSAWYVVGSTRSTSTGNFTISPTAWGTRQYRIVVPDVYTGEGLGVGVTSGAVTTVARPKVTASFNDSTAYYGQKVTARVGLTPKANVRTTLQRWNGTAWVNVKWVYTSSGAGTYTFTAVQRGRVSYRFVVPAFTWSGWPLASQVSPTFVLTTS
ncbi:hypothetical protein EV646_105253 [Kribbella antiqua]|uniref:Fibronectin type-III domain-containing protein n=1 Tax=Kribbella antiqua TaxID=2512217 RepID=A0A4R2ITU1_9ACTN|nr:hypothetical protein [Kribbella antiqua]TCO47699.1 hypothetical protein EV646_105253 [Kribbella antiqua]